MSSLTKKVKSKSSSKYQGVHKRKQRSSHGDKKVERVQNKDDGNKLQDGDEKLFKDGMERLQLKYARAKREEEHERSVHCISCNISGGVGSKSNRCSIRKKDMIPHNIAKDLVSLGCTKNIRSSTTGYFCKPACLIGYCKFFDVMLHLFTLINKT